MENGHDGKLAEKFSGLSIDQHGQNHVHDQSNVSSSNNDNLYQVMKAVEAAEATIKQQVLWLQYVVCYKSVIHSVVLVYYFHMKFYD